MKIQIQSLVDLITNSSTETFVILDGHAESMIRDIVDNVLKVAQSDKTFDDLFVYKTYYDDTWRDEYYEYMNEMADDEIMEVSAFRKLKELVADKFRYWVDGEDKVIDWAYDKFYDVVKEYYPELETYDKFAERKNEDNYDYERSPAREYLAIEPKPELTSEDAKTAAAALNALNNLFDSGYCAG